MHLKQENRDQDILIGQLNERIHALLQARGAIETEGNKVANKTLSIFIDELEKCQAMLSGSYLLQIIGSMKAIQNSNEGVPPMLSLPQVAT